MAESFYEVVTAAVADIAEHGFDSQQRLDEWMRRIKLAARQALVPEAVLQRQLKDALTRVFQRATADRALLKRHEGISYYTLQSIKPKLHAELDRRILGNANLIKLNREASIQRTLQRFSGWATSVPAGGSRVVDKVNEKKVIRKGIAGLPFVERRVIIDQGHKLVQAVNEIVAVDGGAIAAEWHHVKEGPPSYDSRPKHVARNGKVFLVRDSWAMQKGFVRLSGHQYTDQVEQPGEFVFCSCSWVFKYALRALPPEMLTAKGKEALLEARKQIRSFG